MQAGTRHVGFFDEISTGLDSSSTLEICMGLSNITASLQTTTLVALLQPAPETVAVFDDVWIMAGGRLVYQGPVGEVSLGLLVFWRARVLDCANGACRRNHIPLCVVHTRLASPVKLHATSFTAIPTCTCL